jgi:putative ABC transport system ATP-binding protein
MMGRREARSTGPSLTGAIVTGSGSGAAVPSAGPLRPLADINRIVSSPSTPAGRATCAGIDRPTSGELRVAGVDTAKLSGARLADWRSLNVGYIFQLYNLVPVLTAYENVELPLLLRKMARGERHRRVAAAMELVGIADRHDHYPRQLSGGQEQRVAIARAIVTDPRILVADEPTGDLDAESAGAIMRLLSRLVSELGKTLILVTHDAKSAGYAGRVLHLEKGRLMESEELGRMTIDRKGVPA